VSHTCGAHRAAALLHGAQLTFAPDLHDVTWPHLRLAPPFPPPVLTRADPPASQVEGLEGQVADQATELEMKDDALQVSLTLVPLVRSCPARWCVLWCALHCGAETLSAALAQHAS
jgi:hypothetical protein